MSDSERLLDEDILRILRRDAIDGYERQSWQSLGVIAFKLAEELNIVNMPDIDLKEFTATVSARLCHLAALGLVRWHTSGSVSGSIQGFQAVNLLDALAEIVDDSQGR